MSDWTHRRLMDDLAASRRALDEIVGTEIAMGGQLDNPGRVDVAAMRPSWTNPNPTCYEIKVSRSDFNADVQVGKYIQYLPHFRRLYFACPQGLLSRNEVPTEAGLTVRGPNGWRVLKAPQTQIVDSAAFGVLLQRLLLFQHGKDPLDRRRERIRAGEKCRDHVQLRRAGLGLSRHIWRLLSDAEMERSATQTQIDDARYHLAAAIGEAPGNRSLGQLANAAIDRAPTAAPRGIEQAAWALRSVITNANRAARIVEDIEAAGGNGKAT